MEGFKNTTKMKYFKEGGFVTKKEFTTFEKKEDKREAKADKVSDTKIVKAGVRQHESALHKGEPKTELKLKQGGRAKKAAGTVKKFEKASGQYGAKKTAEDKKNIKEAKKFVPAFKDGGKACAPSAAKKAKNTPAKMCGGKSVQKYAEGKMVKQAGATEAQQKFYQENMNKADKKQKAADYEAFGSRGDAARKGMEEGRMDALGNAYKKGGKAKKLKKYADGGTVMSDEEKEWMGGADATDPFIRARMKAALGNKPAAAPSAPVVPSRPNPAMIEDESGRGNVTAAQQLFNQEVPGSGMNTPAMAPSAPVRRPAPAPVRRAAPAPVIEDESQRGIVTPAQQAFNRTVPGSGNSAMVPASYGTDSFRKSAKARQNVGKSIGDFLGLNKNRG